MLQKAKQVGLVSAHLSPNSSSVNSVDVSISKTSLSSGQIKLFRDSIKIQNAAVVTLVENGVVHIERPQSGAIKPKISVESPLYMSILPIAINNTYVKPPIVSLK